MSSETEVFISIISALRDEEENVQSLHLRLTDVAKSLGKPYEIIYVENGSKDQTLQKLKELSGARVLSLRVAMPATKSMQTAALDAGIKAARGRYLVTIDADLQNPPEEIPKMLKLLEEKNYDVVSGWRKRRRDSFFIRNLSRFGSKMRKMIIDPGVHDLGCTLKIYKRECFENVDLYGEMHRYIVAILRWRGFKIGEIEVEHHERAFGKTKYNWRKMFKGFTDMWMIWFWKKYSDRPIHLFGISGIGLSVAGILGLGYLGIMRLLDRMALGNSIWPLVAMLLIIVGVQLFISGMIMDMLIRNYYSFRRENSYSIREIIEV